MIECTYMFFLQAFYDISVAIWISKFDTLNWLLAYFNYSRDVWHLFVQWVYKILEEITV